MGCTGPCQQGRLKCPTPDACHAPDGDEDAPERYIVVALVIGVAFLTATLLALAL